MTERLTDRAGQPLGLNHPLRGWEPPPQLDCIADVPKWLKDALAAYYDHDEPPDTTRAALLSGTSLDSRGLVDFAGSPHGGTHKLLPEWQSQARITPTTIIDHTIVGSGLGAYFFFRDRTGIESHFIIPNGGNIWQLMSIDRRADANNEANSYAISIETEDDGSPADTPWTPQQVASLKWLHNKLRQMRPTIKRQKVTSCRSGGLAYHAIWGAPSCYTPVAGKTCPAAARIRQWRDVLVPAFIASEPQPAKEWWEMPIPDTDIDRIANRVADIWQERYGKRLAMFLAGRGNTAYSSGTLDGAEEPLSRSEVVSLHEENPPA